MTYENYKHHVIQRIKANSVALPNGCLRYGKAALKHSNGLVSISIDKKRKSVPAHRALYMAVHDMFDLSSNARVLHTCGNPRCVNIDHLKRGTSLDVSVPTKTRQRVHDNETILAIRSAIGTIEEIAYDYQVSKSYVSKIRNKKAKALIGG